ncbi:unnamed protein product [Lactuca virosa]|uniref:Uncharacterized protein n=1 Tax=Lactuca virosa TaxID=75947 RepID=A0AAU9MUS0_9ASTR|nr:unnamed protein product [Lactuca virosa]
MLHLSLSLRPIDSFHHQASNYDRSQPATSYTSRPPPQVSSIDVHTFRLLHPPSTPVTAGVSPNFRDSRGRTALHWASFYGREETVVALVKFGAYAWVVDDQHL